ncbi:hypothetical protein D7Y13_06585 [Corallococcus praedator]|uniref:Ferritin-like domain-containing protein n=1 Tax=Corallococcus praedator TaxID=2316724 RepID=A0ABX9QNJ0_9BACT|nr:MULTISPECIES: hypothetical protein [Corallococcus]RKH11032.1 hypothetical protein D7X74_26270 [Corallococcus sp. CA047B]RKH26097.1 hypothetical protein D7X75_28935 [Corallococcus sp. CA031C]RKI14181.1 hypothetical protein D7Y13_06585 [Corallococcus praedator]
MSRRKLRRAFSRLWLLAPVTTLGVGCSSTWGCDSESHPETFSLASLTLADGGVATADTSCEELCARVMGGAPCEFTRSAESLPEPDEVRCQVTFLCEGRRPEGLCGEGAVEGRVPALGALFARMAHLEAASVPAFERLADELAAHGAPERLVRAARRSAGEEVRHARAMEALAVRHGAAMPEVKVAPFGDRSLEALAIENAVEGCVRETFGALLAGWQARCAEDATVRETLAAIAPDELRHSELSWDIDAWAQARLPEDARARVEAARHEAWLALERDAADSLMPEHVARRSGLPSPEVAQRLVRELARTCSTARA